MAFFKIKWWVALFALAPWLAYAGGNEVVVIYNTRMAQSKAVAEHYAAKRHVPADQIFGFPLPTNETMSREAFENSLQKPLARKLVRTGLWTFGQVTNAATAGHPAKIQTRVVQSKIRYAVLCYGVPLKIAPDSKLEEIVDKTMGKPLRRNRASVDSELAWLPLIKTKVPLTGPLRNPFYGCTNPAEMNCTNGLLMVARLDGPTPAIAEGLVDKAIEAENNGLWGRAYFDARGLATNNTYYLGDQWMLAGAKLCRKLGFEVVTDTNAATFPATMPMSHIAIYAGWYSGHVCGPFAEPKVEFMPGAFAYHLYSFSAQNIRDAAHDWCGALLAKGATCTMGSVYEPYLQFTPNIAFFLEALASRYTFGEAAWACQNAVSWQNTVIGDPLYQPFKKSFRQLANQLAREKNPLVQWAFDRVVCVDRNHGARLPQLIQFLNTLPATSHSPVLTEKLATLYAAMGMPDSAIETWQAALKLQPSPQQRLRIRLDLGKQLVARGQTTQAVKDYQALLAEMPDYAGRHAIEEKIKSLQQKLDRANKS